MDRDVAVKVLHRRDDPHYVERFLQEPKAAAKLRHPNIVPVFETGRDDVSGDYFIVSGFIEGRTLEAEIAEHNDLGKHIDFRRTAEVVRKLADGLHHAHSMGIIHRDVKPSNVMIDADGEPHLMDFGLARLEQSTEKLTQDKDVMGTPAYMSPEQAAGKNDEITAATDQYSLGATLYEMLVGRAPFEGPPQAVLMKVLNNDPRAARSVKPLIPFDLDTISARAMSKAPASRYGGCDVFAEDLRCWLSDEPIQARPIGRIERITRWCRREPVVAGLSLLLVAIFAVGFICSVWQWSRAVDERQNALAAQEKLTTKNQELASKEQDLIAARNRAIENLKLAETERAKVSDYAKRLESSADELKATNSELRTAQAEAIENAKVAERRRMEAESLARQAQRQDYISSMRLASLAAETSDFGAANSLLMRIAEQDEGPGQRGFEWYFLRQRSSRFVEFAGHTDDVLCVACITKDGQTLVISGSRDKTVKVWDARTGQVIRTLVGHEQAVEGIAATVEGEQIISVSRDNTVRRWDLATGEETGRFNNVITLARKKSTSRHDTTRPSGKFRLAAAPVGKPISVGFDDQVVVFDPDSGLEFARRAKFAAPILDLSFDRKGERLLISPFGLAQVIDVATGRELTTLKRDGITRMFHAIFSPSGRNIATANDDETISEWDSSSGRESKTFPSGGRVRRIAYLGGYLAGKSGPDIRVWNLDGTPLHTMYAAGAEGHDDYTDFAEHRGQIFAATRSNALKSWSYRESRAFRILSPFPQGEPVTAFVLSPDGEAIACVSPRTMAVVVNDYAYGDTTKVIWSKQIKGKETLKCIAFNHDGTKLVTGDDSGTLAVRDAKTGESVAEMTGHGSAVVSVEYSVGGRSLISCSRDGAVIVWNPDTETQLKTMKYTNDGVSPDLSAVSFGLDSTHLVACTAGPEFGLWNIETNDVDRRFVHGSESLRRLAVNRVNGAVATVGTHTVKLWDAKADAELHTLAVKEVKAIAFNLDGTRIATGGRDGVITILDADCAEELIRLKGHNAPVTAVSFVADGRQIVSGDADGKLLVWGVPEKFSN